MSVPADLKAEAESVSSVADEREWRGAPQGLMVWLGIFSRAPPLPASSRKASPTTGISSPFTSSIFLLILSTSSKHTVKTDLAHITKLNSKQLPSSPSQLSLIH